MCSIVAIDPSASIIREDIIDYFLLTRGDTHYVASHGVGNGTPLDLRQAALSGSP
ncbi:hypothetical protein ACFFWD_07845 [Bradyrhizobium erythrophlei]|uniref:hypothetical protein n=1 Tax=Bradyrhizobium erythrophlei TaxID=1437360 RepID=UPI0035EA3093